jgi:hypothetical protein
MLLLVTNARAAVFRRYLNFRTASSTLWRTSGPTFVLPFKTLETVCWDTPASLATSIILAFRGAISLSYEAIYQGYPQSSGSTASTRFVAVGQGRELVGCRRYDAGRELEKFNELHPPAASGRPVPIP